MLNPVAPILEGLARTVVLGRGPELPWVGYSAAMALLFSWGGIAFFRRLEPRFAESV
jgi:ABC-type polysaccharide/polyol phosphate export permease